MKTCAVRAAALHGMSEFCVSVHFYASDDSESLYENFLVYACCSQQLILMFLAVQIVLTFKVLRVVLDNVVVDTTS
jgi:hypothetical protein